jgi:hypothetical protein
MMAEPLYDLILEGDLMVDAWTSAKLLTYACLLGPPAINESMTLEHCYSLREEVRWIDLGSSV